jgi:hypothetical protein
VIEKASARKIKSEIKEEALAKSKDDVTLLETVLTFLVGSVIRETVPINSTFKIRLAVKLLRIEALNTSSPID